MTAEMWVPTKPVQSEGTGQVPDAQYGLRIDDTASGRSYRGSKTVIVYTPDASHDAPVKAVQVHLELGNDGFPPAIALDYRYDNFTAGLPAVVTVTAVDATNTVYAVTYYHYSAGPFSGRPAGSYREDHVSETQLSPEEAARQDYYRYEELRQRIDCRRTEGAFWVQMEKGGVFSNPVLSPVIEQ